MAQPIVQSSSAEQQSSLLEEVVRQLQRRMRKEQFETWFRGLHLVHVDKDEAEFSVPSSFVRDWLTRNYLAVLQESVAIACGGKRRIRLSLREVNAGPGPSEAGGKVEAGSRPPTHTPLPAAVHPQALRPLQLSQLNPNYTFDQFVVGPCNQLGHASALAIAENPGHAYNPLFVHGNTGLGKTHLLQAICHTIIRRDGNARVLYVGCEDFTNSFIKSIQNGTLDEFRSFHRGIDVLVIDDVQFLANKEKTQEEFFHTFNALYNAQKQIVISSDRPPPEIPTVEERLVSRFKWGLVTEFELPCFETRVAIVKRKAKLRGVDFTDEVAYYVAKRIATNIRELEGAVIKVIGIAAITDRDITPELAQEALRGVVSQRRSKVSVDDVMSLITSEFSISTRDLTGKSRTQAISLPRQIAMYLMRDHTDLSLEDVGRFFGNRDHTTVLYAVGKIRQRSEKEGMFKELLDGLSKRLLQSHHR